MIKNTALTALELVMRWVGGIAATLSGKHGVGVVCSANIYIPCNCARRVIGESDCVDYFAIK